MFVPDYIYRQRRSLHELYLDYNQIKDLPPVSACLFVCCKDFSLGGGAQLQLGVWGTLNAPSRVQRAKLLKADS